MGQGQTETERWCFVQRDPTILRPAGAVARDTRGVSKVGEYSPDPERHNVDFQETR